MIRLRAERHRGGGLMSACRASSWSGPTPAWARPAWRRRSRGAWPSRAGGSASSSRWRRGRPARATRGGATTPSGSIAAIGGGVPARAGRPDRLRGAAGPARGGPSAGASARAGRGRAGRRRGAGLVGRAGRGHGRRGGRRAALPAGRGDRRWPTWPSARLSAGGRGPSRAGDAEPHAPDRRGRPPPRRSGSRAWCSTAPSRPRRSAGRGDQRRRAGPPPRRHPRPVRARARRRSDLGPDRRPVRGLV